MFLGLMKSSRFVFVLFSLAAPLPALAQAADNSQVMERMDRLDHDVQLLQQQISNGAPTSGGGSTVAPNEGASLEVRLSNLQDEIRGLRGQLEENQFQIRKVSENLDKLSHDTDFRFNELSKAAPPALAPAAAAPSVPPAAANGPAPGSDGILHLSETDGAGAAQVNKTDFATPKEHYNYAFRLLEQTQYPEAAASFDAFIKKYPKDNLVGNAWYWEGETYYIRRDYVNAADDFRQGFEALPEGPKAADNLFKLALSLDALNRDKEACVVLTQVATKFKKNAGALVQRAEQEQKRIGCH